MSTDLSPKNCCAAINIVYLCVSIFINITIDLLLCDIIFC